MLNSLGRNKIVYPLCTIKQLPAYNIKESNKKREINVQQFVIFFS